jgi:hypothetical protein
MIKWFGQRWPSGLCDDCEEAPVPVGAVCIHCDEPITAKDSGIFYANVEPTPAHRNCFLRQTIGSLAHVLGRCSCFVPGSTESDPPEMSRREAADAAVQVWEIQQRRRSA